MIYTPDNWVVIKIKKKPVYKVFAGWSGSYLYGTSWKLNSGITKVTADDTFYNFEGHSGSTYMCHKGRYGINTGMLDTWRQIEQHVLLMDENTPWCDIDYLNIQNT